MSDAVNALRFRPLIPSAADDPIDDAGDDVNTSLEVSLTGDSPSYEFLRAIVADPNQSVSRRIRCAVELLPYEVPKLTAQGRGNGKDFAAQLEQARARSRGGSAALLEHDHGPADDSLGVAPQNSSARE